MMAVIMAPNSCPCRADLENLSLVSVTTYGSSPDTFDTQFVPQVPSIAAVCWSDSFASLVYRPNAFITSSVVIGAGGRLEKVIIVCQAKLTIPSLPFLFIVVFSNESAIYFLPLLCSRSSRPSRKNVCDRELSGKFDVAAVSKIHFNVIFSKAAPQNQQIF